MVSDGSSFEQKVRLGWESCLTVVALPPIEGSSSDQEVEDESEDEPEGVLCCVVLACMLDQAMIWDNSLLVFAGGMFPAALKKMGTLMNLIQVCGKRR